MLGSHVRMGEPLKASKWESRPKTRRPRTARSERPPEDDRVDRYQVDGG